MLKNFIEFKFNELGDPIVIFHNDGKFKVIKNFSNVMDLLDIFKKYGYNIEGETRIVRHSRDIMQDYATKKYNDQKIHRAEAKIYGDIKPNMKISRKNKNIGTRIAALALTLTFIAATIKIASEFNKQDKNIVYGSYISEQTDYQTPNIINEIEDIEYDEEQYQNIIYTTVDKNEQVNENMQDRNKKDAELNQMMNEESFHFSYEDRSQSSVKEQVDTYDDIFQKYAKMYGVDVNLLKAIAAQESGGDHYGNIGNGPAEGIMQIEKIWYIGYSTYAYNVETGETDEVYGTEENIQDIDTNIKLGAMVLSNCLNQYDYNIPLAIQAYNFGPGNIDKALTYCSNAKNTSEDYYIANPTETSWLDFRNQIDEGDSQYIEHVLSYLPNNSQITVLDRDGNTHSITIQNDNVKSNIK